MPKSWYAVHTTAGHENKVRDVLTRRAQVEGLWNRDIFEILIPTERELTTRDAHAASAFYTEMFGWSGKHSNVGTPTEYHEFGVADQPSIGMMPMPQEMPSTVPSYWMPYFQVANCDASTAKAKELGGKAMVGPQDIPSTGRFTIVSDPQGAIFALFQFAQK